MKNKSLIAVILACCLLPQLALAGNVFKGQEVYQIKCAQCHGQRGEGMLLNVPDFSRGETILKPEMELVMVIKNGKGMMPGFMGQLKEDQISDVIAFIRSLY